MLKWGSLKLSPTSAYVTALQDTTQEYTWAEVVYGAYIMHVTQHAYVTVIINLL